MKTIERMRFTQVEEGGMESARQQLAKQASSVLGYHQLAYAVAIPSSLMFALRDLGIEPLLKSSVEAYMERKARPGMRSSTKTAIKLLAAGLSLLLLASAIGPRIEWGCPSLANIITILMIFTSVLCLIGTFVHWGIPTGPRVERRWTQVPLHGYPGIVPEFVLDRAIQIATAVPDVTFGVLQLTEQVERRPETSKRDPDPFLVATLRNESYFIDVWDEKEYERTI